MQSVEWAWDVAVISNFAIGFNTTMVIAMGFWLGMAIVGLFRKNLAR